MESDLCEWYKKMVQKGIQVTNSMLKEQARKLSRCPEFLASKGWLDKYKQRHNVKVVKESKSEYRKLMKSIKE